jgi:hypothetical protein
LGEKAIRILSTAKRLFEIRTASFRLQPNSPNIVEREAERPMSPFDTALFVADSQAVGNQAAAIREFDDQPSGFAATGSAFRQGGQPFDPAKPIELNGVLRIAEGDPPVGMDRTDYPGDYRAVEQYEPISTGSGALLAMQSCRGAA